MALGPGKRFKNNKPKNGDSFAKTNGGFQGKPNRKVQRGSKNARYGQGFKGEKEDGRGKRETNPRAKKAAAADRVTIEGCRGAREAFLEKSRPLTGHLGGRRPHRRAVSGQKKKLGDTG